MWRHALSPVLALALAAAMLPLSGCGPSAEERKIIEALNKQPELLERGGRVKKVEVREGGWGGGPRQGGGRGGEARGGGGRGERQVGDAAPRPERPGGAPARGGFYGIEAEIVDAKGVAIGRLRSQRVEGFGTMKPRIKWYATPGVPEEW